MQTTTRLEGFWRKNNKFMEIWVWVEWNEMCQRFLPLRTYLGQSVLDGWWDWNSTRIPFHSISPSIPSLLASLQGPSNSFMTFVYTYFAQNKAIYCQVDANNLSNNRIDGIIMFISFSFFPHHHHTMTTTRSDIEWWCELPIFSLSWAWRRICEWRTKEK